MTAEQTDPDDLGHMPSMSTKTREIGKLQDMYRRTLAASWAAQAGELPADKCIEDIFAGGDGWGGARDAGVAPGMRMSVDYTDGGADEDGAGRRYGHQRKQSSRGSNRTMKPMSRIRPSSKGEVGVSGRASIEQQVQSSSTEMKGRARGASREIDEFAAREDLRSWAISSRG